MLAVMAAIKSEKELSVAVDEDELARLKRDYLPMWAGRERSSTVGSSFPSEVPYVDYMKPGLPWAYDTEDQADPLVCRIIDEAINELSERDPTRMGLSRAALSVRYMSARLPAVFRSGRLTHMEHGAIEDLADEAERRLVPIVKRRNLPL